MFHEELCRQSFRRNPLFGTATGCQAQRALFHGGTLQNGKVSVEFRQSHGRMLRELIARVKFKPGADVTCYGGFVAPSTQETDKDTHMRHIPLSNYILAGRPFSNCFPTALGSEFQLGYNVSLQPRCEDPAWTKVIRSNGIGYMSNTVTKCPLRRRARTNVTVCEATLGRHIPGVPYNSIMIIRANSNGIEIGDRIISPYEPWKLKEKFQFVCVDQAHYAAAGRTQRVRG
jgi:hypothetical protein